MSAMRAPRGSDEASAATSGTPVAPPRADAYHSAMRSYSRIVRTLRAVYTGPSPRLDSTGSKPTMVRRPVSCLLRVLIVQPGAGETPPACPSRQASQPEPWTGGRRGVNSRSAVHPPWHLVVGAVPLPAPGAGDHGVAAGLPASNRQRVAVFERSLRPRLRQPAEERRGDGARLDRVVRDGVDAAGEHVVHDLQRARTLRHAEGHVGDISDHLARA